jgi:hypothetical protein
MDGRMESRKPFDALVNKPGSCQEKNTMYYKFFTLCKYFGGHFCDQGAPPHRFGRRNYQELRDLPDPFYNPEESAHLQCHAFRGAHYF